MLFTPYLSSADGTVIPVQIREMKRSDAQKTVEPPVWQSNWTTDYIIKSAYEKYAVHTQDGELAALGMYEPLERAMVVRIVYMESHPASNPTISGASRKYYGIGRLLIAFGIKLSIDHGFGGDVMLEAKTDALARHYQYDFGGIPLPAFGDGAPRFLIQGDAARNIFFDYLK